MSVTFNTPYFQTYAINKVSYLKIQSLRSRSYAKTTCAIVASHDSRMRCFVESVAPEIYSYYRDCDGKDTAYLFKHCATLKVSVYTDLPYAIIELVYAGELSNDCKKNGKYYVMPNTASISPASLTSPTLPTLSSRADRTFLPIIVSCDKLGIKDRTRNYNIYIVRHGESDHNLKGYYKDSDLHAHGKEPKDNRLDTNLTTKGIAQAKKAGTYLASEISKIDHAFCSVLVRTRQTMSIILESISCYPILGSGLVKDIKTIIVAPCSREIKYGNVKGCFVRDPEPAKFDDTKNVDIYRFNQPKCAYLEGNVDPECLEIDGYAIDPKYYIKYHKEQKCNGLSSNVAGLLIEVMEDIIDIES